MKMPADEVRRITQRKAANWPRYLNFHGISARFGLGFARQPPMPQRDPTVILSLVDKLYAAALNGAEWGNFLSSAADAVGADHAFVCQLDFHRRSLSYVGLQQ